MQSELRFQPLLAGQHGTGRHACSITLHRIGNYGQLQALLPLGSVESPLVIRFERSLSYDRRDRNYLVLYYEMGFQVISAPVRDPARMKGPIFVSSMATAHVTSRQLPRILPSEGESGAETIRPH